MRRLGWLILLLFTGIARAQEFATGFELPLYSGSMFGQTLSGQDGWFNPVAGSVDLNVYTYQQNIYGFAQNPQGSQQFAAGLSNGGTAFARAQRSVDFSPTDTWTLTWDMAAQYLGSPPATDFVGSLSLQDSAIARYFIAVGSWVNPASPTAWNMNFIVFDASGTQTPQPGLNPGPQWQNLQVNHWYRFSTTFNFVQNRILNVSITDLTTLASAVVSPTGWYLQGGATPGSTPLPTAIRLFSGGTTAGNAVAWDNIDACPFQVTGFDITSGPEGTIVHIFGCGFGTDPAALSVSVRQGSTNGVAMTVLAVTDSQITARLGPVPPSPQSGQIMVVRGTGNYKLIVPTRDDVIPEEPLGTEVWNRGGDRSEAISSQFFFPQVTSPPLGVQRFIGQNAGGQMLITVAPSPGIVQPNTTLRVIAKLHQQSTMVGSDVEATAIRMRVGDNTPSEAQYLADRVSDVIQSAFSAHGVNSSCQVTGTGPSRQITVRLLDGGGFPVSLDFGVLAVEMQDPIRITPFAIGPVTAFYHAGLMNQAGSALVNPVDLSGNDGATISPNVPVTGGLRVDTDLIPFTVANSSFTVRAWGFLGGQPNQLIGTGTLHETPSFIDALADFSPIGASQVRLDVYYNTALKATALVPAGSVAHLSAGPSGLPAVTGCGGRPTIGASAPFLWIDLDPPCLITPTIGSPVIGNQLRLTPGSGAGTVQNFQAFDLAAGLDSHLDFGSFVIFSSVEGGICYANCDGSTTPPALNILDFACFINLYASGNLAANCDGSVASPVLNVLDFACFLNAFAAGCP